jgi:hypothetical protein
MQRRVTAKPVVVLGSRSDSVTLQAMYDEMRQISGHVKRMEMDMGVMKKRLDAFENSDSSSGSRVACPLGCGGDFKKVNYLLDHLYRACKISARTACQSATALCQHDPQQQQHQQLWHRVFGTDQVFEQTDENVSAPPA